MTGAKNGKRELLEGLLEKGVVMVVLDARRPGVAVPASLARDPQLRLNLSWRFGFSMELDEWGVKATLTFAGSPFDCRLPWNAIYAMVSHSALEQQYVFPGDLPEELRRIAEGEVDEDEEATAPSDAPPDEDLPAVLRRAHLAVVEGSAGEPSPDSPPVEPAKPADNDEPDPEPPRTGGRPHLRLVK